MKLSLELLPVTEAQTPPAAGDARVVSEAIQMMLDVLKPSQASNMWGNGKRVRAIDAELLGFAEQTLENASRLLTETKAPTPTARELRMKRALECVARVLGNPHPGIVDTIWRDQNPKGVHITLFEEVMTALGIESVDQLPPDPLYVDRGES